MINIPPSMIQNLKKGWVLAHPFIRPSFRTKKGNIEVNLWVASRKLPFLMAGAPSTVSKQAMIVPVAPDLKMVFGVAKIARDQGADAVQYEANKVAPLAPGEAFIGSGARYHYQHTVLAVIFDEVKRTNPDLITQAFRRSMELAIQRNCTSIILPDITENLLAQPNWITPEQRNQTAEIAALTTVGFIRSIKGTLERVNVWCWNPDNAPHFLRELKRL